MEVFSSSRWRLFLQKGDGFFFFKILLVKLWAEKSLQYLKLHCCVALSLSLSFFLSLLLFSPLCAAFYARFGKFHNAIDLWAWQKYFTYACALPRAGPQHKQDMSTSTSTQHTHTHHRWLGICPFWPPFPALTPPPTCHFNAAKFVNNSFPRFGLHKLLLLAVRHNKLYDVSYPKATFLFWPPLPPSGTPLTCQLPLFLVIIHLNFCIANKKR